MKEICPCSDLAKSSLVWMPHIPGLRSDRESNQKGRGSSKVIWCLVWCCSILRPWTGVSGLEAQLSFYRPNWILIQTKKKRHFIKNLRENHSHKKQWVDLMTKFLHAKQTRYLHCWLFFSCFPWIKTTLCSFLSFAHYKGSTASM